MILEILTYFLKKNTEPNNIQEYQITNPEKLVEDLAVERIIYEPSSTTPLNDFYEDYKEVSIKKMMKIYVFKNFDKKSLK